MAKNYSYPRVTISQFAKTRSSAAPAPEDTTVLFMPFIADKGPLGKDEQGYHPIHNLSDFIEKYGDLDFEKNGETALIIYNWLSAGGTVSRNANGTLFPYRLDNYGKLNDDDKKVYYNHAELGNASKSVYTNAKYIGSYYNKLVVKLATNVTVTTTSDDSGKTSSVYSDGYIFVDVNHVDTVTTKLESFRFTEANMDSVLAASNVIEGKFIEKTTGTDGEVSTTVLSFKDLVDAIGEGTVELKVTEECNPNSDSLFTLVDNFWSGKSGDGLYRDQKLSSVLEAPVDVIIDAGYPKDVKDSMRAFIGNQESNADKVVRPDIVGLFTAYTLKTTDDGKFKHNEIPEEVSDYQSAQTSEGLYSHTNVAVWDQYFLIEDAIFTNKDIYVTPMYFLSKMIPYNDFVYGVQFPIAGLTRGILEDAKAVNENPTPARKDELFKNRINYVEKSSREYAFMSQRTWDASTESKYTSLSFLNNVRALEKMKRELYRLGRAYLFEYNDSVTLSQMRNVLNRYMAGWVANRTLSYADVTVAQNAYSTEAVDINLVIRFNNTIEVISVDITIE